MQKNTLQFQLAMNELTTTALEERINELAQENIGLSEFQIHPMVELVDEKKGCVIM